MQILSTKISIPPLRSRLVARPRLIQKLNLGSECGFVLVSAPAGYGKSTLLSAWLGQAKLATAWLSLDDGDNDPGRFLAYLAAALQGIDPALNEALEIPPKTSPLPEVEILLTPWVNHLSQVEHPFWLVLDDYHLIQDQVIHQMIRFLLENRPAPLHLAIAVRADPPLPLARLRARAEMLELRQADLCFTAQEASEFLNHTMGLQISSEDVASITTRTEGWIAGLQIAALSMQNMEDVSGFISSLSGSDYYIFDYLVKEVLAHQTPEFRRFLLYTSILDQLSASLCDALLLEDEESTSTRPSAAILDELDHANLFVIPLDYEHCWYRYHHLFCDLLRLTLEQTYPGLSLELHRRACRWYESQEMVPEALQHAISSGDMQLVAQIVSANVLVLVENDESAPTLKKIDSLPPYEFIDLPWLGIARSWIQGAGQIEKSHQILDAIEKSLENMPDSVERQRLKGHIAASRAFVFNNQGKWANVIAEAKLADELLPPDEIAVRALSLAIWGKVLAVDEFDSNGLPILEQALALALQAKKPHAAMIAAGSLAEAHLFAGRMHALQRVCLDALAIEEDYQRRYQHPLSAVANIYTFLARVLAEWGENEKAIQLAHKGLRLSERWGRVGIEVNCLLYLGRVLMFANDPEQARQVFQRVESTVKHISPDVWKVSITFILDSLLDSETPDSKEINRQIHLLEKGWEQFPALLTARLLLRDNRPDEALVALEQALAKLRGRPSYDFVRIYALRALAFQAKGDEKQALAALQQALESGEPENRVATFVREGAAMESLLRLARAKGITPQFVQRLLAAFESRRKHKPGTPIVTETLVEPLSARELEVLNLLAQGCADKQIAEKLVISNQTVHKHLKNIYSKLDVHSRTEAIARAREMSLL